MHGYAKPWPAGGGKNLFDVITNYIESGAISSVYGTDVENTTRCRIHGFVSVEGNTQYTVTVSMPLISKNISQLFVLEYGENKGYLSIFSGWQDSPYTFTTNENTKYIRLVFRYLDERQITVSDVEKVQVEAGSSATDYAPYSNICPISGWTGAEIEQTGVNVWDEEWEVGTYDATTGEPVEITSRIRNKNKIVVIPGTTYYFVKPAGILVYLFYYDANENYITLADPFATTGTGGTFTIPANAYFMNFIAANSVYHNDIAINYPATVTTYSPYTGNQISVTFPSEAGTVYGGMLTINQDRTGTLVVDMAKARLKDLTYSLVGSGTTLRFVTHSVINRKLQGSNTIPMQAQCDCYRIYPWSYLNQDYDFYMCGNQTTQDIAIRNTSISTVDALLSSFSNDSCIVYELAEPQTYQLTTEQVSGILTALDGTNVIWANTGNVTVTYIAKSAKFSFGSPLHIYNYSNLKLFGNTYIEHGKG